MSADIRPESGNFDCFVPDSDTGTGIAEKWESAIENPVQKPGRRLRAIVKSPSNPGQFG